MFECRKVGGLIAASLYEALTPPEQDLLDTHLAKCAGCRREADSLGTLARAIPVYPVEFHGDLLPVVRQRLSETGRSTRWFGWRWAVPMAGALMLALVLGARLVPAARTPETVVVVASPLEITLVAARNLAKSDFTAARALLKKSLAAHADDPRAGEAQLMLAELEFDHGQRYREAYDAYETLRLRYNDTFAANPQCVLRFNVLDEARAADFDPLYALDAARNSSGDPVSHLEKVVSRYPGTLVASLGVDAMAQAVGHAEAVNVETRAAALETVRECCSDPAAIAQINLALGDLYWEQLHDPAKARPLYTEVAECPHTPLAQLARLALAQIDATADP
jgi:hypothetical protein